MPQELISQSFPLNEDIELINLAKNGDNEAIKSLINKHSGICVDTYKKYINLPNVAGFISDEIISNKDYIIYNSAQTYDPSMGSKFSTWLSNQTRFFCLNCINKYNKLIPVDDADLNFLIESRNKEENPNSLEKETKEEVVEIIKQTLLEISNKKIKECINRKYFSSEGRCKTYTEVAEEMNVTVQTIINWHKKFINLVKEKCKNKKIIFDKA
jgi:RNA polymerase sigma factor (sigma-70 family)